MSSSGASSVLKYGRSERVAWIGIGDSNQMKDGYGWDNGITRALSEVYGLWGTGWQGVYGVNAAGSGGYDNSLISDSNTTNTGAPGALALLNNTTGIYPNYSYVPGTTNVWAGLVWNLTNYGGKSSRYRFHYTYGKNTGWTGSFQPVIRLGSSPFTAYVQASGSISTGGSPAIVDGTLDLPANSAANDTDTLEARWMINGGNVIGPWFGEMQSVENLDRTTGFSYQTLGFYGGMSARVMANTISSFGTSGLTEYMRLTRSTLGTNKVVIVGINEGMNDRNDTSASVGPIGGLDSSTAAGFSDNVQSIINAFRTVYTANGWDQSYLFFVLMPSHPISTPDDSKLSSYRAAADALALRNANTVSLSLDTLISGSQVNASALYYSNNTDTNHLAVPNGYYNYAQKIVAALSGNAPVPSLATSGMKDFKLDFNAACDGTTDDTATLNSALTSLYNAGGGTLQVTGTCKIAGAVVFPNDNNGSAPKQVSIRITGKGGASNGYWSALPNAPSVLDLTYNASVAKLDTRGAGILEIDHLVLKDSGSDCAPFIQTTNTTVSIHDNAFSGTASGASACNDGVILGGSTATVGSGSQNQFQGYGSYVEHNFFDKIRRIVYIRAAGNANSITGNLVSASSGSNLSSASIASATNANPASLTRTGHGVITGQTFPVTISGGTGSWTAINGQFTATSTGANTFTIPVDSTSFGALAGSPVYMDGAAIEIDPTSSAVGMGNVITGNTFEMTYYPYGVKFRNAARNVLVGNGFWDGGATKTLASYRFDDSSSTSSAYNMIVDGFSGSDVPAVVSAFGPDWTNKSQILSSRPEAQTTIRLGALALQDSSPNLDSHLDVTCGTNSQAHSPISVYNATGTAQLTSDCFGGFNPKKITTLQYYGTSNSKLLLNAQGASGTMGIQINGVDKIFLDSSGNIIPVLPTSCSGKPTGTLWNNASTVAVCP